MKLILALALALIALSPIPGWSADTDPEQCRSKRGGDMLFHCNASIYSLVASPERFADWRVFTVGYLVHEKHGSQYLGLAPTPSAIHASDFLSCIHIVASSAKLDGSDTPYPERPGIYIAEVSGQLRLTPDSLCIGELHDARLYNLRVSELYGEDG